MKGHVLRQPRRAVAPVVGTIMMVAVTVVLAAVVFFVVSSMLTPPPAQPVSIAFSPGSWDPSTGNNTASITSTSGANDIRVSGVTYVVRDPSGLPYFSGKAEESMTSENVTVTVHYTDHGSDDRINVGDEVSIDVTPISAYAALQGGILEMHFGGRQIASHAL